MTARFGSRHAAFRSDSSLTAALLLTAIGCLAVLAWLRVHGEAAGWFDRVQGTVIFASANVLLFAMLLWWKSRALQHAYAKLQHRERLYAVLSQVNQGIVQIADRDVLFARVCEVAIDFGKFRMAWIGLADHAGQQVKPVAWAGADDGFLERAVFSLRDEPAGQMTAAASIRDGGNVICNHVDRDPRMTTLRDEALKRGYRAAAAFPLRTDAGVIGTLVFYAEEPDFFDADEVKLLDEVAGDLSFALRQMEREEQRRQIEADFRASFCSSAVGQVQADPATGRYLRVNPRFCEMTGYSEQELLGMSFRELTHPLDRAIDFAMHERMVRGDFTELAREKRYVRKDGTSVWVSITASIIRDDAGRPLRTLAVVHDITEQKRLEDARRAAEAKYRVLVEQSLVGIYVIQDDRFVYANPKMCELFGYTASELGAEPVASFIVVEDRATTAEYIRQRMEGRLESVRYELRMRRKDGSIMHIDAHGGRATYNGRPAILGTFLDITEHRKLEEQLLQSQKMEAMGHLAGGIAHDFNNLLTAIVGNVRLALDDLPPGHDACTSLHEIDAASTRAADLVRRILTFSRQEKPTRKPIQLHSVVEEALQLLRSTLPATIEIRTSFAADAPAILGDASQVHQVLMNLGTNASHAMDGRGVLDVALTTTDIDAAHARVSAELREGRYVRLSVSDDGCGMDRATLARIFEPFFTTKAQGQGTGLGLSVVHGIMKNHDGAVTAYSQPGQGTVFHLYFPANTDAISAETPAAAPAPLARGTGQRILFVDDEQPLVRLATEMLTRLGYRVAAFSQPQEALAAFRAAPESFDLVVSDLSMPGLAGPDLAREVLQLRPHLPVIITTGYIRPQDADTIRSLGIRALMFKPNTIEEMAPMLHRLLTEPPPAED